METLFLLILFSIFTVFPIHAKDIYVSSYHRLKEKLLFHNQDIKKKSHISVYVERHSYFPEKVLKIYFDNRAMSANKGKTVKLDFLGKYIKDNNITGLSLNVPDCDLSFVSKLKIDLLAISYQIDFDFTSLKNTNVKRFIYGPHEFGSKSLPDFPNLEDLSLSLISRKKFDISLLDRYPKLKKLRLSNVQITGTLDQKIIDNIVLLSMHGQGYETLLRAPQLISLSLIRDTVDLKDIYDINPKLKAIELFYCKLQNIDFLSKLKHLQAVTISHADENILAEIAKTKVDYINLKPPLRTNNLDKLSGLKKVKILNISHTRLNNITGISKIPIDYLVSSGNYYSLSDKDYAQTRANNVITSYTLWFKDHGKEKMDYFKLRQKLLCDYVPNPNASIHYTKSHYRRTDVTGKVISGTRYEEKQIIEK